MAREGFPEAGSHSAQGWGGVRWPVGLEDSEHRAERTRGQGGDEDVWGLGTTESTVGTPHGGEGAAREQNKGDTVRRKEDEVRGLAVLPQPQRPWPPRRVLAQGPCSNKASML